MAWLTTVVAWCLPIASFTVPSLYLNVPPAKPTKSLPVVFHSHGLTGTNDEHQLLHTHLVQQGFVVVAPTHCDGSASAVTTADGSRMFYQHPDFVNYDHDFRIKQVDRREKELYAVKQFVLHHASFPAALRALIDDTRVLVSGFSYGATTASLSTVRHPGEYRAVALIDGWFSINLAEVPAARSDRVIAFPPEAHAQGLSCPALFVGSEHFATRPHLATATQHLIQSHKTQCEAHVISGSFHQNFCDLGFWVPCWLLTRVKAIGPTSFHDVYAQHLALIVNWFQRHV